MRPARRSAPAQRAKLARNPPRQCPVASVTSIETKPAAARRAQYSAMLGSRLAGGTWPNSDRIVVLLSQKVATNDEENHLFGKIHSSAMGGWNGSAKIE